MWKVLIPVISSALLAWGAWNTMATTSMTPREVFDQHVKDDRERFESMQNRIEDKLDRIREHLMEGD